MCHVCAVVPLPGGWVSSSRCKARSQGNEKVGTVSGGRRFFSGSHKSPAVPVRGRIFFFLICLSPCAKDGITSTMNPVPVPWEGLFEVQMLLYSNLTTVVQGPTNVEMY